MGDRVSVPIRREIYDRVRELVSESDEFSSVEDFVEYVLEEVLREEEGGGGSQVYTAEEEEEIKKRLRDLGYL